MDREQILHKLHHTGQHLAIFAKWSVISILVGGVVGLIGTAFYYAMMHATTLRVANPALIWALPITGLAIVLIYRLCKVSKSLGTNLVILSVRSEEAIPAKMAPLIFVSTVLTHLGGGSAGREGAALQLGGSLAQQIGRLLHLNAKDLHIITMCGMSAAFSALFGTPLTAAIFSLEVVSVGVMYYAALVPCAVASLLACEIATALGTQAEAFTVTGIPAVSVVPSLSVAGLAALCALLSVVFCRFMRDSGRLYEKLLPNPFVRVAVGGLAVALLSLPFGTDYLGAGLEVIGQSMEGAARPEAFFLKMVFTALTLGAGYKGGEIVPCFFTGATFGCVVAPLLGLSPSFGAALGLMALFCGVTNCPVTSMLLSFELFGFAGAPYFLLAAAISYMLSGYYGLYSGQKILYSKFRTVFIDKKSK